MRVSLFEMKRMSNKNKTIITPLKLCNSNDTLREASIQQVIG